MCCYIFKYKMEQSSSGYVKVVPWVSRVYGICTLSVVICILEDLLKFDTTAGYSYY